MKPTNVIQQREDENYQREADWLHRCVLRLARKHINRVAKCALSRAYNRGQITSEQMHSIAGCIDRILWPERYKRERGTVIQSGNIVRTINNANKNERT